MTDDTLQELYAIRHPDRFWKIGTAANTRHRLTGIQTGCPYELECKFVVTYLPPDGMVFDHHELEKEVHAILKDQHVRGEWYDVGENTVRELFERQVQKPYVDEFYVYPEHEQLDLLERKNRYHDVYMRVTS